MFRRLHPFIERTRRPSYKEDPLRETATSRLVFIGVFRSLHPSIERIRRPSYKEDPLRETATSRLVFIGVFRSLHPSIERIRRPSYKEDPLRATTRSRLVSVVLTPTALSLLLAALIPMGWLRAIMRVPNLRVIQEMRQP